MVLQVFDPEWEMGFAGEHGVDSAQGFAYVGAAGESPRHIRAVCVAGFPVTAEQLGDGILIFRKCWWEIACFELGEKFVRDFGAHFPKGGDGCDEVHGVNAEMLKC